MDAKLVAWGRAVKARGRWRAQHPPPLWLFTDSKRVADPVAAVRALPKGLCGVVFRHDGANGRAALAEAVARVCRQRRLSLVVAGAPGLAHHLRAGLHLRGGRGLAGCGIPATSSAHGVAQAVRARRAGAGLVFVSPVFPTPSHPGTPSLGVLRWALIVRCSKTSAAALGGVDGAAARRLPRGLCRSVGAIGGLLG